jgi:hypothetical protein
MVYLAYKTSEQRMRQQYMVADRGDIAQFRHREVRWEGLIIFSAKQLLFSDEK